MHISFNPWHGGGEGGHDDDDGDVSCLFIFYCQRVGPCAHAKLWLHLVLLIILRISRAMAVQYFIILLIPDRE